ncbi:MAG TPA: flagellar basal body rod protein FlgC [Tepidisphaeraceae bacterium]|jgi:flagellar basal-body rod protein FlgC|nr:flagellar basal body rod protein FlgC [Tepidisphaeraceae bacterium]
MFDILDMGASGLEAQRARLDVIAENITNAMTIYNAQGQNVPYRRKFAVFAPGRKDDPSQPGVHLVSIDQDMAPFPKKYDPGAKGADKDGYIRLSNVDSTVEYVNALEASRAYEANVTLMETSKAMINSDFRILA